jgi:hypothetical protein
MATQMSAVGGVRCRRCGMTIATARAQHCPACGAPLHRLSGGTAVPSMALLLGYVCALIGGLLPWFSVHLSWADFEAAAHASVPHPVGVTLHLHWAIADTTYTWWSPQPPLDLTLAGTGGVGAGVLAVLFLAALIGEGINLMRFRELRLRYTVAHAVLAIALAWSVVTSAREVLSHNVTLLAYLTTPSIKVTASLPPQVDAGLRLEYLAIACLGVGVCWRLAQHLGGLWLRRAADAGSAIGVV